MQDKIIKFLAYEGRISLICIESTNLVEEARKLHDLSPVATAVFGRVLTMTSMMGSELKGEKNKITVQIKGDGEIGSIVVTTNKYGNVKGYVLNPHIDLPLNEFGKLDVGGAVGQNGYINVVKDIGMKEPYVGISTLVSGEIADDFANYFVESEQRKSAVALGVLVDKNGVKKAGGYLINAMPDATNEDINSLEKNIFESGAISKMLDNNLSLLEIAKKVTGDENVEIIEEELIPKYICDCSKENMEKGLMTIGIEELEEIIKVDKKAELVCHFCNKKYTFLENELQNIVDEIKSNKE